MSSFLGACADINPNSSVPNLVGVTFGSLILPESSPYPNCTRGSYLRPDVGGALIPWAYSILVLIVHVPTVAIRFVRWETAQSWVILFTLFTVFIFIQAYESSGLTADKVFVWTPVTLVIDAGSMLHLCVLIIEGEGRNLPLLRRIVKQNREAFPTDQWLNPFIFGVRRDQHGGALELAEGTGNTSSPQSPEKTDSSSRHPYLTFAILILAFILFLIVLALQIHGLRAAVSGLNSSLPPPVSWCSPIFQPYGAAVLDGNCNIHPIIQDSHKGIGCIFIDGTQEESWLKFTVAGTVIAIVLETIDFLILVLVNSKYKIWTGVKMKRPWLTMIAGLAVLFLILVAGYQYAMSLPPDITERVMVVISHKDPFVCVGMLTPAGLRGAVIGWTDGVFSGWKTEYYGRFGAL